LIAIVGNFTRFTPILYAIYFCMKKIIELNLYIKIALILTLITGSYFGLNTNYPHLGYLSLFAGLFILFEGFGFSLIVKILFAMVLGITMSLLAIKTTLFAPQDIVAMKPVGSVIFMNCLTMTLVPLVFSSILTGVTNLGDIKKLNRVGLKTITYYLITTAVAITIGLGLANIIKPGNNIDPQIKKTFVTDYSQSAETKVLAAQKNKRTLFDTFQDIFPKNIMEAVSLKKPEMLQLIFFAVICGIALLKIKPTHAKPVIDFFSGITDMTVKIISMIMRIAPYGVFTLIAATIAQTKSFELIYSLIPFSFCVLLGLIIHGLGTNFISLKYFSKRDPKEFFKTIKEVVATAFSTSSSGATMPLTLKTSEEKLNVKKEIASFVVPLGATINMDGAALFQGVAALFLANIYGIELGAIDQITVIAMAVMASIGTAAVPGVGIVVLTMILVSVGIPPEGILFILPVNNILDMCRTVVNVTGDMACAVYIDSTEAPKLKSQIPNKLQIPTFNNQNI